MHICIDARKQQPRGWRVVWHRRRATVRRSIVRFFDRREWFIIGAVGVIITSVIIAGYLRGLGAYREIDHARTVALVALIVASSTLTAGLNGVRSRSTLVALTLGSALALVQTEPLARLLHLSPLASG